MVQESSLKFFGQCFMAGCYIGFGAQLAVAISAAMPGITEENPGLKKLIFAYLFPVNLVLITLTGGVLYTGTAVATPAAFFEKKASFLDVLRCLALSWVGNLLGSLFFAGFILWCDLLDEKTQHSFLSIAESKTSKRFDVTLAKGIGCNWMVSMAVLLAGQAQDMFGKVVAIYLPISTFVMLAHSSKLLPTWDVSRGRGHVLLGHPTEELPPRDPGQPYRWRHGCGWQLLLLLWQLGKSQ